MPTSTYDLIASSALSSNTATVTFSSIPSTYRDLVVVLNLITTTGGTTVIMQPNGDTSNSTAVMMQGTGSSTASSTYSQLTANPISSSSDTRTFLAIYNLLDYAQTDKHKTVIYRANQTLDPIYSTFFGAGAFAGRWASTSSITSLSFVLGAGQFAANSTFDVYGIAG